MSGGWKGCEPGCVWRIDCQFSCWCWCWGEEPYLMRILGCRMGGGWIEKGAGQVVSTEVWRIDLYRTVSFWRIDCRHKDSPRLSLSIQPRDQVSQAEQRICWFSGMMVIMVLVILVVVVYWWYVVADMEKLQMYLDICIILSSLLQSWWCCFGSRHGPVSASAKDISVKHLF